MRIHPLILVLFFLSSVLCDLDVKVWVEPGYYYGYQCQLSFQFIADNFSAGQNIHISTDGSIGFEEYDYNSMFIQAADGKQYQFYSYQCPVTNRNQTRTCFQAFGQMDNIIPKWAQILQVYNSTHKYFLTRIKIAYCPLNHTITPSLNIVVPQSYSGSVFGAQQSGIKYNKTINLCVSNLNYRDLGWVSPTTQVYQLGCSSTFKISWTFIEAQYSETWNEVRLKFDNISKISIDITNCAPSCELVNDTLYFTNPNRSDIVKNISRWDNHEYNQYSLESNRNISSVNSLSFTFNSAQQTTLNYTFSVSSKFLYNHTLPKIFQHQNITYHGVSSHSMRFMNDQNYNRYSGTYMCNAPVEVPQTNNTTTISFIQSLKNFMSQFSLVILGIYCLLILVIRRIPFLLEKIVYILLCVGELPVTIACLILEEDQVRFKTLVIFVIVEQILSKIFFIHYYIIFFRKQGLKSEVFELSNRVKIYLMNCYNFRLCYVIYSKIPCCTFSNIKYKRRTILLSHLIHLILGCGIKLFVIVVNINVYLINIDSFTLKSGFMVIQILCFALSMLIIKYSLVMWRNNRAKEFITKSKESPILSVNNGMENQVNIISVDSPQQPIRQVDNFMRYQVEPLPTGVSEIRGLAAYSELNYQNQYYSQVGYPRNHQLSQDSPPLPPAPSYYPSLPAMRF